MHKIESITGNAIPLLLDDIETDRIIPARYLRCVTFEGLGEHAFKDDRQQHPTTHPFDDARFEGGSILVAGRNFGCGSSRPGLVLREVGIAVILAESVSRLYLRNNIARGIPIFMAPGVTGIVQGGDQLDVDYQNGIARNPATGATVSVRKFPPLIERIFAAGGLPELARARYLAETA